MPLQSSQTPRRPALWAGFAAAIGVWLAGYRPDDPAWSLTAAALCIVLFVPGLWSRPWRAVWPYLLLLFLAGSHLWVLRHVRPDIDLKYHTTSRAPVLLYGRVDAEPDVRPNLTLVYLAADSVRYPDSVRRRRGGVLLRLSPEQPVQFGDYLVASGELQPIDRARNPGEFDYAAYLARRDIHSELTGPDGPVIVGRDSTREINWTASVVAPLRAWIHNRINRHIHGEPAALVMGLMFGERKRLEFRTLRQFQDTGTLHLLAVSGSNVAVVIAVVWAALALFRIPRWPRTILTLIALILFCALSRNQPSVVRASVAGALVLLGHTWHRRIDPLNIWGGSLLLILLAAPAQLFDVGFQLSFAAALGIIVFAPVLARWPAGRRWHRRLARVLVSAVGVSIVAQLAVTPILASSFNRVPTVTPLSNLVCVPLAGLATAAGLVTLLLAPLGGVTLSLLSGATWFIARLLLAAVDFFDRLGLPVAAFASPSVYNVIFYYLAVILTAALVLRPQWWRRVVFGLLIMGNLILWPALWPGSHDPEIVVLDCGPSAVSLIRWPESEVWMVEQRVSRRSGHFARVVEPFLRRRGWKAPTYIWLLDGKRNAHTIRKQWPAAHLVSTRPPHVAIPSVDSDPSGCTFQVEVTFGGDPPQPRALRISGPGGQVIWLAPEADVSLVGAPSPELRLCLVAAAPPQNLVNWTEAPPIQVIASSYPHGPNKFASNLPNAHFMSTVSSGGIQISGLAKTLRTEPSIR